MCARMRRTMGIDLSIWADMFVLYSLHPVLYLSSSVFVLSGKFFVLYRIVSC